MAQYRITEIEDYDSFVGTETIERIRQKAANLKGLRVANFNSTYYGGGVAETISSLTLLMNSLGLRTEWRVIQGTPDFFSITKKMHNALQGVEIDHSKIKNRQLSDREINERLSRYEIPTDLPLVVQVSRFDPWKDPKGVVDAFKLARKQIDARLVLLGNFATDDPEGEEIFHSLCASRD